MRSKFFFLSSPSFHFCNSIIWSLIYDCISQYLHVTICRKKCRNYNRKLYLRSIWRLLMAWQKHSQCTQVSICPGLSTAPVTVLSRRRFCSWFWCNHFLGWRIVSSSSAIRIFSVLGQITICFYACTFLEKHCLSSGSHHCFNLYGLLVVEVYFYQLPHLQTGPNFEFELYIKAHLANDRAE